MAHADVQWMEDALCASIDAELFHPTKGGPEIKPARTICDQCDVRLACVNYAIRCGIIEGIWGGYSGQQLAYLVERGTILTSLPQYSDRRKLANARRRREIRAQALDN